MSQYHTDTAPPQSAMLHTSDRIAIDGIADFWPRVRAAGHVSLFLDYDGTLAPFHADRLEAFPLPGTANAIREIITHPRTTVALVSGRPVAEILALLGDLGVLIVGSHGYEVYRPDGAKHVAAISPQQASTLDRAYEQALVIFDAARVERKAASVAAHFRGLDPRDAGDIAQKLEHDWRAAGVVESMEFRPFNGGLELRAAGRNKGTAIIELIAAAPSASLPVYIGDDDTDEDAFAVLPPHGIGIKVGPPDAVTRANGRVASCEDVRQILIDWSRTRYGQ